MPAKFSCAAKSAVPPRRTELSNQLIEKDDALALGPREGLLLQQSSTQTRRRFGTIIVRSAQKPYNLLVFRIENRCGQSRPAYVTRPISFDLHGGASRDRTASVDGKHTTC
jgi:hypothetical protein